MLGARGEDSRSPRGKKGHLRALAAVCGPLSLCGPECACDAYLGECVMRTWGALAGEREGGGRPGGEGWAPTTTGAQANLCGTVRWGLWGRCKEQSGQGL